MTAQMSVLTEPKLEQVAAPPESPPRRAVSPDLAALLLGCVVMAAPFVLLHHVNTLDGPGHLLGGEILGKLRGSALVSRYYDISFSWVPNIQMQYVLAALTSFLSPTWAEKLYVVGYVFAFPLAFRYAVRSVDRRAGWLALCALPLTVGRPLLEGFYSFDYAMISALLAVGLTIRARGRWNPWNTAGVALLLVLTYSAHPVPLVMAVLVIGVLTLTDLYAGLRAAESSKAALADVLRNRALGSVLALTPALLMTLAFAFSGDAHSALSRLKLLISFGSLVNGLVTLSLPIVSYTSLEYISSVLTVLVLAVLVLHFVRASRGKKMPPLTVGLAAVVAVCVVVYFVTPNSVGAIAGMSPRLAMFVPLSLVLLCASVGLEPKVLRGAGLCFLAAAVILVGVRLPTLVRYDHSVSEFLSVEKEIPSGATLLEVRFGSIGRFDPLTEEASRVAADRGDLDLLTLEGQGPDYQQTFRPQYKRLSHDLQSGRLNLVDYERSGGQIDYVLVVGPADTRSFGTGPGGAGFVTPGRSFEQQLRAAGFVKVMTSSRGLVRLYRHQQTGEEAGSVP
jgi:hypothetical protein